MTQTEVIRDLPLSCSWKIWIENQEPNTLKPFFCVATFSTIIEYWDYCSTLFTKNALSKTPCTCRITICREYCSISEINHKLGNGEWKIELKHDSKPISIINRLTLLVISEQMSTDIVGLSFKVANGENMNINLSIWTENTKPTIDAKNILLSQNVIDLNYCVHRRAILHSFTAHIAHTAHKNFENPQNSNRISEIRYSLHRLLEYKAYSSRTISWCDILDTHFQTLDARANDKLKMKTLIRTESNYNFSSILKDEGCIVCLSTKIDDHDSNDEQHFNDALLAVQCPLLCCQHLMHKSCLPTLQDNIILKSTHSDLFFETIDLSGLSATCLKNEIGQLTVSDITNEQCYIAFKVNHLISDQLSLTPGWPILCSVINLTSKNRKCVQLFFSSDNVMQIFKGRMQFGIVTVNTGDEPDILMLDANFSIPRPNNSNNKINKIYQLRLVDPRTNNTFVVNLSVIQEPHLHIQLLSLRYEFVNKNTPLTPEVIHPTLPNEQMNNDLYEFACSKQGSKYILTRLEKAAYFSVFLPKLQGFYALLMSHECAHLICRKLYSSPYCTMDEKIRLLQTLPPYLESICKTKHGSFELICLMSLMTTNGEIETLGKALESCSNLQNIVFDSSGYHVIKKFVAFGYPHYDAVIPSIVKHFSLFATHHYGVPIIRNIFDSISSDPMLLQVYSSDLLIFCEHTPFIVNNQYGNYVIQQLLEMSPPCVTDKIKTLMLSKYGNYSKQKFSSNVVEKCLKHSLNESINTASIDWKKVIVMELLQNAGALIDHKYGNYCMQTALLVSATDKNLFEIFTNTCYPLLDYLKPNIKKKWHQLLEKTAEETAFGSQQ